eukprot:CAMPEP_0170544124 /NCGR_PEP_ID=MMETSP0211-20121228/3007_1 /TAXON_ID=311385 /ORGANISM="Pseudokeronopsis sp., Strain OXSARD2" /LENGTH=90 /DNA_ID=CAMNT_0010847699 /DNA_START=366 /DNA_END=635 /DNA_ORIENTATION=+
MAEAHTLKDILKLSAGEELMVRGRPKVEGKLMGKLRDMVELKGRVELRGMVELEGMAAGNLKGRVEVGRVIGVDIAKDNLEVDNMVAKSN